MPTLNFNLSKFLMLAFHPERHRTPLITEYVRTLENKENGVEGDQYSFYSPFWSDAKRHVEGESDLDETTAARIAASRQRRNLYPILSQGFQRWWSEERRLRNEPYSLLNIPRSGEIDLPEGQGKIRVNNCMALEVLGGERRYVFPYFSKHYRLDEVSGRIGLWIIGQALREENLEPYRLLDVLAGTVFQTSTHQLRGDEERVFKLKAKALSKLILDKYDERADH